MIRHRSRLKGSCYICAISLSRHAITGSTETGCILSSSRNLTLPQQVCKDYWQHCQGQPSTADCYRNFPFTGACKTRMPEVQFTRFLRRGGLGKHVVPAEAMIWTCNRSLNQPKLLGKKSQKPRVGALCLRPAESIRYRRRFNATWIRQTLRQSQHETDTFLSTYPPKFGTSFQIRVPSRHV